MCFGPYRSIIDFNNIPDSIHIPGPHGFGLQGGLAQSFPWKPPEQEQLKVKFRKWSWNEGELCNLWGINRTLPWDDKNGVIKEIKKHVRKIYLFMVRIKAKDRKKVCPGKLQRYSLTFWHSSGQIYIQWKKPELIAIWHTFGPILTRTWVARVKLVAWLPRPIIVTCAWKTVRSDWLTLAVVTANWFGSRFGFTNFIFRGNTSIKTFFELVFRPSANLKTTTFYQVQNLSFYAIRSKSWNFEIFLSIMNEIELIVLSDIF